MFLEWMILYATEYQDIQEKVHNSIKETFGLDGIISLQDEHRLPLLSALMEEIHRHSPAITIGVPQCAEEDVSIQGYNIPKGSLDNGTKIQLWSLLNSN